MLPPGFLFRPSDEVLLVTYLKNKLLQWPLPCDVIVEADVYGCHPQDLALEYLMANRDFEWFFFTSTPRKHPGASETSRASRRAGLGRWKATKGVKNVVDSKNNTIGSKKSFCYMEQNSDGGENKSIWLMEEFSMQNLRRRGSAGEMRDTNELDDWVISKIYLTPKARKAHADLKQFASATLEPAFKRRRIEVPYSSPSFLLLIGLLLLFDFLSVSFADSLSSSDTTARIHDGATWIYFPANG
ncbi:NAC domain-containing protein 68-like [Phoenix dactylifera]|uniref:NAC domain-containing protein 68-like n=1 Tax=Phoenix dactylifera TaxID=42345 RepID=A0A8B9A2W6_PHODC|nr:NAC domain-containing protein 68-like [Phoenix dactylifera]